jgi:DNA-binding response OmpR family regulator
MLSRKRKILAVSRDPKLADIRKTVLEKAGFSVIPALDDRAVEHACSTDGINLIMLGYSLDPADKRRVWAASRRYCNVPILELHKYGAPELVERNVYAHESQKPDDFLQAVLGLLRKPKNGKA